MVYKCKAGEKKGLWSSHATKPKSTRPVCLDVMLHFCFNLPMHMARTHFGLASCMRSVMSWLSKADPPELRIHSFALSNLLPWGNTATCTWNHLGILLDQEVTSAPWSLLCFPLQWDSSVSLHYCFLSPQTIFSSPQHLKIALNKEAIKPHVASHIFICALWHPQPVVSPLLHEKTFPHWSLEILAFLPSCWWFPPRLCSLFLWLFSGHSHTRSILVESKCLSLYLSMTCHLFRRNCVSPGPGKPGLLSVYHILF